MKKLLPLVIFGLFTIPLTLIFSVGVQQKVGAQTQAQIGNYFAWDHDGLNVDHFEVNIDFVEWLNNKLIKSYQIPSMQASLHTFYVRACATTAQDKCSDPISMQFVIVDPTLPNKPSNLRILTSPLPGAANVTKSQPKNIRLPSPPKM